LTRRFSVKVAGRDRLVELEEREGALRLTVDGAASPNPIDAWRAEPGVWVLRQGTAQAVAQVDGAGGKLTVELRAAGRDPVVVSAEVTDARSARAAALAGRVQASAAGPLTVRSPIPGRVVKLLVRPGDRVGANQATVVVEAMKMENELRAPRAGTVQDVRCVEGAAVEAGQDLVVIA
jgi:biotin carboxyl carrier protein